MVILNAVTETEKSIEELRKECNAHNETEFRMAIHSLDPYISNRGDGHYKITDEGLDLMFLRLEIPDDIRKQTANVRMQLKKMYTPSSSSIYSSKKMTKVLPLTLQHASSAVRGVDQS